MDPCLCQGHFPVLFQRDDDALCLSISSGLTLGVRSVRLSRHSTNALKYLLFGILSASIQQFQPAMVEDLNQR
jgi:hypothetical protein